MLESVQPQQNNQQLMELRSLFEMSQILNASLNINEVLNTCLLTPMGRMMISRGCALVKQFDNSFCTQAAKGIPAHIAETPFQLLDMIDHPIHLSDLPSTILPQKELLQEAKIELLIPMVSANRVLGLICLGKKLTAKPYQPNELEFLHSLSNIAAIAIENAMTIQTLEKVNRNLDKKVQELDTLFSIGKDFNSTIDKKKILNMLMYTIMGETTVKQLLVYCKDEKGFTLEAEKGRNTQEKWQSAELLQLLHQVQNSQLLSSDDSEFQLLIDAGIQAVVPMTIQDEIRGIVLIGSKINGQILQQNELDFISTLCNRAMLSLENIRLFHDALEKQRLEEEMAIAHDIQKRLLPGSFPQLEKVEIYGMNIPCRHVGGDFFFFFQLDDQHIAITIGDVSGKGVGASLLMSNLHAGLHSLVEPDCDLPELVSRLNNLIHAATNYDKFITFFYAEVDLLSLKLRYVNAGHNPPYVFHKDGSFYTLNDGGLILGMMPNVSYEMGEIDLNPGDYLITFTDGVTEAKAANNDMYEEERLEALIKDTVVQNKSITQFADILIQQLDQFCLNEPQTDDITMLGLKVLA